MLFLKFESVSRRILDILLDSRFRFPIFCSNLINDTETEFGFVLFTLHARDISAALPRLPKVSREIQNRSIPRLIYNAALILQISR